jgi:hypothetical protein
MKYVIEIGSGVMIYTGHTQENGAVSKADFFFKSHFSCNLYWYIQQIV